MKRVSLFLVLVLLCGLFVNLSPIYAVSRIAVEWTYSRTEMVNVRLLHNTAVTLGILKLTNDSPDTLYWESTTMEGDSNNTFPNGYLNDAVFSNNGLDVHFSINGFSVDRTEYPAEASRLRRFGSTVVVLYPGQVANATLIGVFNHPFSKNCWLSFTLAIKHHTSKFPNPLYPLKLQHALRVVDETPTVTYELWEGNSYNGWHLISFPMSPVWENIFNINPNLERVLYYDASYGKYVEVQPFDQNLRYHTNVCGLAFWVKVRGTTTLSVTGEPIWSRNISVAHGWNLLGSTMYNPTAVRSQDNIITACYEWNRNSWYTPVNNQVWPWHGIWVYAAEYGAVQMGECPPGDVPATLGKVSDGNDGPPPPPWKLEGGTDVEQEQNLPVQFSLGQNYPNPFNPTTTINYIVPPQSNVLLAIYNIDGQLIRTLVTETKSAGQYMATWDATDDSGHPVSSGVYLYRLNAGQYSEFKRMLLVR